MKKLVVFTSVVLLLGSASPAYAGTRTAPSTDATNILLAGSSYTVSTGPSNVITGRTELTTYATLSSGHASGNLRLAFFACVTNGIWDPACAGPDTNFHQVSYADINIQCLSGDTSTHTVWFSGQTVTGDDLRERPKLRNQEHSVIARGNEIVFGRVRDQNGDSYVDTRSLFISAAGKPYPNAITTVGAVSTPWFIQPLADAAGGTLTASNACNARDSIFEEADYKVVGSNNQVQWLEPDDTTTIGSAFTGSGANLKNPPAGALYDLSSINRTFQDSGLSLNIS